MAWRSQFDAQNSPDKLRRMVAILLLSQFIPSTPEFKTSHD